MKFHLAQLNIARMIAPLDDPLMAGFVSQLDTINALADASPGFVWRLQGAGGDATTLQSFEDPLILVNMSVWESLDALHQYVYGSDHLRVLKQKKQWFVKMAGHTLVLWWVPQAHRPTVEEAKQRLELLNAQGPTPAAFSFARNFPAPDQAGADKPGPGLPDCSSF